MVKLESVTMTDMDATNVETESHTMTTLKDTSEDDTTEMDSSMPELTDDKKAL